MLLNILKPKVSSSVLHLASISNVSDLRSTTLSTLGKIDLAPNLERTNLQKLFEELISNINYIQNLNLTNLNLRDLKFRLKNKKIEALDRNRHLVDQRAYFE